MGKVKKYNMKKNSILDSHLPCPKEVDGYLRKWEETNDYTDNENALNRLFLELVPDNRRLEDILLKCSILNDFYSTNIFKIHNVAKHYLTQNIDERLAAADLSLVEDLAMVIVKDKPFRFYSFASKYCSHHRPEVYPIYDSYVHKVLKYFRDRDSFDLFLEKDLKIYNNYVDIINAFRKFYGLEDYSVKQVDQYLWQLGKETLNK